MASIPLKAQVAIRDHWTAPSSPLRTSLQALESLLGLEVSINPEWPLLIAELDPFYAEKGDLVVIVAGCVRVWVKGMTELLEDAANEAWTDMVVEKVKAAGRMRMFLDVGPAAAVAATAWSEQCRGFVISLPKKRVIQPAELHAVFRGGLLNCFAAEAGTAQLPGPNGDAAESEWVGIENTGDSSQPPAQTSIEFLPSVLSLPRPDELFLKPPYYLTMTVDGQQIELQCSHSPSLQLVADYLMRWCRVNHADARKPPGVQIRLQQSAFGLGEMFDRLLLGTENTRYTTQFQVTAPMIAAFIERILGYELLSKHGSWTFRRDTEFKML
ncbi:hypothetical protein VTK26DRAFT_2089 [Humicola hyalothermophila]